MLLVGNPNSGKSTIFNQLTGLSQRIANYPGVTVVSKYGKARLYDAESQKWDTIEIVDLPGIYSLEAISEDETEAVTPILHYANSVEKDDILVLFVADTNHPSRSLYLFHTIRRLGFKTALLWNLAYMAGQKGIIPQLEKISQSLPNVPVAVSDRSRGKTANTIKKLFRQFPETAPLSSSENESLLEKAKFEQEQWFQITPPADDNDKQTLTDKILMHKYWGPLIFVALMFIIFQCLFTFSAYPMKWIEDSMAWADETLAGMLPVNQFTKLIIEGIIPGISGVLVFIPQIAFLFLFISIMEESGYLARVTFLADSIMRKFGMNGKSLIPFAGGAACAIPAVMSARTIANKRERLITILMTPWVTCSARLPVFVTLIAVFVPEGETGFLSTRGLVLAAFYMLGILAVFMGASLLNLVLKKEKRPSVFIMELPDYRMPSAKSVAKEVWGKVTDFVTNAGKIILSISVILWVLASYGPTKKMEALDARYALAYGENYTEAPAYKSEKLETSYAGHFGHWIEPVVKPLGFDWKIGIGILTSFAAREIFVGTMNTIYGLDSNADEKQLSKILAAQKNPDTGAKMFNTATSLSLMVFFLLAMQCMSTFAVVQRETRSVKIALAQLVFMSVIAYFASMATYRLVLLL